MFIGQSKLNLVNPLVLEPDCWLDASDLSTIDHISNKVSSWRDKSRNPVNFNVGQGAASKRPTTNVTTINGKNVIDFDPTNIEVLVGGMPAGAFLNNTDFTIIGAILCNDLVADRYFVGTTGNVLNAGLHVGYCGANMCTDFYLNQGLSAITRNTNLNIFSTTFKNVGTDFSYNFTPLASSALPNAPLNTAGNFNIGGGWRTGALATDTWNGSLCEIFIKVGSISAYKMQVFEGYLAWRWGLVSGLPVSHPFKYKPPRN